MKQAVQNKSATLVAATQAEIQEDGRVHAHRAAAWKLERALHQIRAVAYESEAKARAEYLEEIAEATGQEEGE